MLLPCVAVDTTRVTIREADPDVPGSDYINANYIRVSHIQEQVWYQLKDIFAAYLGSFIYFLLGCQAKIGMQCSNNIKCNSSDF